MNPIIDALVSVNHNAILYLSIGAFGGFLGQIRRFIEERKTSQNDKKPGLQNFFRGVWELLLWIGTGAAIAFTIDVHPALSFLLAFLGPNFIKLVEKNLPEIVTTVVGKRFGVTLESYKAITNLAQAKKETDIAIKEIGNQEPGLEKEDKNNVVDLPTA